MPLNASVDQLVDEDSNLSSVEQKRLNYPKWGFTLVGIILLLVCIFGLVGNITVLRIFSTNKQLRSPTNIFIIGLSACDLCMALFGLPLSVSAAFAGRWVTGDVGCEIEAFIVYVFGLTSVYVLTAISMDRYIVISRPLNPQLITRRVATYVVIGCFAFGLFWTLLPVFGWNGYGLEVPGISCGLQYHDHSVNSTSYIITIFIFCFLIPICLMVFCYFNIFMTIRSMGRTVNIVNNQRIANRNQRVERKMLKTCILVIVSFWVCWTPYAVVSFWQSFGNIDSLPLTVTLVPAIAAKCQLVFNPVIYVATNSQFRNVFRASLPCQFLQNNRKEGDGSQMANTTVQLSQKDTDLSSDKRIATISKNAMNPCNPGQRSLVSTTST